MKRFTETDKWRDPWFRSLSAPSKLVFFYVLDNCNNAGFLELDRELLVIFTKMKDEHLEGALKGLTRGIIESDGWLWVRRFLRHQKNESLNPENPAHKQIISLLSDQLERFKQAPGFSDFIAPYKGLFRPIGEGKGTGNGKGTRESPEREKQAEEIYQAYPRREKKPDALRAILAAMDKSPAATLLERTRLYASIRPLDQYTPLPASWFNAEQFNDDPENWKVKRNGAHQQSSAKGSSRTYGTANERRIGQYANVGKV